MNICYVNLAIIEEPNFGAATIETVKLLMEGEHAYVPLKNQPDAYIDRTPILIITNHPIWYNSLTELEAIKTCMNE